jgi:hypothetical protein
MRGPGFGMFMMTANATVNGDGTFKIRNLAPGEYKLTIRNVTDIGGGASVQEAAAVPIVISGVDIDNVTLISSSGWSIAGRVVTDTGEALTIPRERVRIVGVPLSSDNLPLPGPGGPGPGGPETGRVGDDGSFTVTGLYGPTRLRVNLPDGWMVKAVRQDGRDISEAGLDGRGNETVGGVEVVVTNRVTTVSGQLTDDKGAPVADGTIIIFSSDAERWSEDSRFVRSARPDQQGKYQVRGLPAGQYLAVAIDYVEEGMWNDPQYLESISRYGQRLSLGEADTQTVALKLITPRP